MELDVLLKLQKLDRYKEGELTAIPMCSVCQLSKPNGCKIYGECPQSVTREHKKCDKAILDKTSFLYPRYMELYGYRHKDKKL